MEEKRKRTILWIIVIAGIVIILGVVWYFVSRTQQFVDDGATATPDTNSSGSPAENGVSRTSPIAPVPSATQIGARTPISASKTATVTQTATATASTAITNDEISKDPILSKIPRNAIVAVTPYPGSGDLDWTRHTRYYIDVNKLPKTAQKTPCESIGLSENWDNPVEKFACDSINFFSGKLSGLLNQINCELQIFQYQSNYDQNIVGKYEDSLCKVEDR